MSAAVNDWAKIGRELEAMVKGLSRAQQRTNIAPIIERAVEPVLTDMQANTPVRTGTLRDAENVKIVFDANGVSAKIGVTHGPDAPHAHLIEQGTKPRIRKSDGKSTGSVQGRHFIRSAADSKGPAAVEAIRSGIGELVERLAR